MTLTHTRVRRRSDRLSKQDWLAEAMAVLSKEGGARITIHRLCEGLSVTKGSFYAHFKGRDDFIAQLIDYWGKTLTQDVIDAVAEKQPAEDRLKALMQTIDKMKASKYDTPVRAWAAQDLLVAKGVQKVDRQRFKFVRSIFCDLGIEGEELDLRTRLFVTYHSAERGMHFPRSKLKAEEHIDRLYRFFTRP